MTHRLNEVNELIKEKSKKVLHADSKAKGCESAIALIRQVRKEGLKECSGRWTGRKDLMNLIPRAIILAARL